MPLSIGIIGMPNVGKSTLFNALSQTRAEVSNYPFCTIDRNVGVAEVPDEKLQRLNELLEPEECVPTAIQFIDIAGLVRGASRGEGLGNKFLGHIRNVDAIAHVVRCFDDDRVTHVDGSVDPVRDIEIVNTELTLADLETAERGVARAQKVVRTNARASRDELELLTKIKGNLEKGVAIRELGLSPDETEMIKGDNFLTAKPILYVANIGEDDIGRESDYVRRMREYVGEENVISISVKIEEEISELPEDERGEFLAELGLGETGLNRLVLAGYRLLSLITFYTIAKNKLRAWQVVRGTKAPDAAGKVHSDMERGFIRAEVASYEDVERYKTMAELHRHGLVRVEGKEYVIRDEDVVYFLFNV